jgi:hypothetical protein
MVEQGLCHQVSQNEYRLFLGLILVDSVMIMWKNPVLPKRLNLSFARNEVKCHAMVQG